ncbi:MAG: heme ABC exporter ATP-binding protein CcmA, partial [Pseudomonadota bacterium]
MPPDSLSADFTVRDLTIDRGGVVLIDALSFGLSAGDMLVLRGPNGSGKTSLLRVLAGIGAAQSGAISACGVDQSDDAAGYGVLIGYWGHRDGLKEAQTALASLQQWQALSGQTLSAEDADAALEQVGLAGRADFPVRTFSAGQRRRLGLVRLLCKRAQVWLLDEPFTALDQDGRALLTSLFEEHRKTGGIIIAALHD